MFSLQKKQQFSQAYGMGITILLLVIESPVKYPPHTHTYTYIFLR